jgi:hypothetical protein
LTTERHSTNERSQPYPSWRGLRERSVGWGRSTRESQQLGVSPNQHCSADPATLKITTRTRATTYPPPSINRPAKRVHSRPDWRLTVWLFHRNEKLVHHKLSCRVATPAAEGVCLLVRRTFGTAVTWSLRFGSAFRLGCPDSETALMLHNQLRCTLLQAPVDSVRERAKRMGNWECAMAGCVPLH